MTGWRVFRHRSKSPVPRRNMVCPFCWISSLMSRGKQGSRYGVSGVRPVCFPRSLQDKEKLHHETNRKVAVRQCFSKYALWDTRPEGCLVGTQKGSGIIKSGEHLLEPLLEIHDSHCVQQTPCQSPVTTTADCRTPCTPGSTPVSELLSADCSPATTNLWLPTPFCHQYCGFNYADKTDCERK